MHMHTVITTVDKVIMSTIVHNKGRRGELTLGLIFEKRKAVIV